MMRYAIFALLFTSTALAQTTQPTRIITGAAILISQRSPNRENVAPCFFHTQLRPGKDLRRRASGDLEYDHDLDALTSRKHTGDKSTVVDLGEKTLDQIESLPRVTSTESYSAPAALNHAYLVHVNDLAFDDWVLFRVTKLVPRERCEIEWARVDQPPAQPGPVIAGDAQARLAGLLCAQDTNIDPATFLQQPKVILQVRAGAIGGNPSRIDMTGETSIYVGEVARQPLLFNAPPNMREGSRAYFSGGPIAPGKCFVITTISYKGVAAGDSNGHGEMIVHAGDSDIIHSRDTKLIPQNVWTGHIEIHSGDESKVFVEIANSSYADVTFSGDLIDDPNAKQK